MLSLKEKTSPLAEKGGDGGGVLLGGVGFDLDIGPVQGLQKLGKPLLQLVFLVVLDGGDLRGDLCLPGPVYLH